MVYELTPVIADVNSAHCRGLLGRRLVGNEEHGRRNACRTLASERREYLSENSDHAMEKLQPIVQKNTYFTKKDFLAVCKWKSPRSEKLCQKSEPKFIMEISHYALKAEDDRAKIELWTLLDGVDWPTASVFMHWFYPDDKYPILDVRALQSLSIVKPKKYDFEFWWDYTVVCRSLAITHHVDMRTLDRALWQYSKKKSN